MEFKVGEIFSVTASVDEDDICFDSNNVVLEVHVHVAITAGRPYVDVMITVPASSDIIYNVSHDPLDTLHASHSCSLPSPSPGCHIMPSVDFCGLVNGKVFDCMDSLGTFRRYNPSLDPHSFSLESMPLKIMFITAFTYFNDFSKAFEKFRRALVIIPTFLSKCSYLHSSEFHAQVFDKLLRALTASDWQLGS